MGWSATDSHIGQTLRQLPSKRNLPKGAMKLLYFYVAACFANMSEACSSMKPSYQQRCKQPFLSIEKAALLCFRICIHTASTVSTLHIYTMIKPSLHMSLLMRYAMSSDHPSPGQALPAAVAIASHLPASQLVRVLMRHPPAQQANIDLVFHKPNATPLQTLSKYFP